MHNHSQTNHHAAIATAGNEAMLMHLIQNSATNVATGYSYKLLPVPVLVQHCSTTAAFATIATKTAHYTASSSSSTSSTNNGLF